MSADIHEDPNVTVSVRYSRGVREDGGQGAERRVDINGTVSTQDRGQHTQKYLPAAQRKSLRSAALTVSLGVLLVVGVTVLSRLYISVIVEKQQLKNRLEELQTSFLQLQTRFQGLQTPNNKYNCKFQEEESWKRFRCSCYYKSAERKNWTESRRDCRSRGADLVIINNKDEDDFVGDLGKDGTSWIGLSVKTRKDWELKSEWTWVDGSAPGYMGWRQGATTTPEEGSVAYIDLQGTWDHTKEGVKHWICERPIN